MITGWFNNRGQPFIHAVVILPRLRWSRQISILADTGCSTTTLHPRDCEGLPYEELADEVSTRGVGGEARCYVEEALVVFPTELGSYLYRSEILFAKPSPSNERLPSLLGQDIMRHWGVTFDQKEGLVLGEVHWADYELQE